MKELTTSQKKAIQTLDKNILISASAGSGKTSTMVDRTINILLNQSAKINEILALTFTENSATEMKTRIYKELLNHADKPFIKSQLNQLSTANISTFDAFCSNLIKEFFYIINVDPNFSVLNNIDSNFIKLKILNKTIEEMEQNKGFVEFSSSLSGRKLDRLFEIVLSSYDLVISLENADDYLNQKALSCYETDLTRNDAFLYLMQNYKNDIIELEKEFLNYEALFVNAPQILENLRILKQFFIKFNESNQNFVRNAPESLNAMLYSKNLNEDEKKSLNKLRQFLNKTFEIIEKYKIIFSNGQNDELIDNLNLSKQSAVIFIDLLKRFIKNYETYKKENCELDFNDLENFALKILQNENVQNTITSRFKHIDIDEYQDTNEKQEAIINKIIKNSKVFCVGDPKQSIYLFRHCKPSIFINKALQYKQDNTLNGTTINFVENFRSHTDILKFVNLIFNEVMTIQSCGLDYKNESQFITNTKKSDLPNELNKQLNRIKIYITDSSVKDDNKDEMPSIYSVKNSIAQNDKNENFEIFAIIQYIKNFFEMNEKIFDKKNNSYRIAKLSDFAILTRNNNDVARISNELRKVGFAINSNNKMDLNDITIIKQIHNLLNCISNCKADIPLASSLLFIGDLDENDLATIKLSGNDEKYFYEIVENYNKDDIIKEKITSFYNNLNNYRFLIQNKGIYDTIKEVILKNNIDLSLLKDEDNSSDLDKLNLYLDIILKSNFNYELADFLNFTEHYEDAFKVEFNTQTNVNAINVLTIHKSKGLEFPVVILFGANKKFDRNKSNALSISDRFGIGFDNIDIINRIKKASIIEFANKEYKKNEERKEEMRVLYVALTRAEQYLCITADVSSKLDFEKLNNERVEDSSSYLEWILKSTKIHLIDNINNYTDSNNLVDLEILRDNCIFDLIENKKLKLSGFIDNDLINKISEKFNSAYKFIQATNIQIKNSVSKLLLDNVSINSLDDEKFEYLNNNIYNSVKADASVRGIAYHKAMECIDFNKSFEMQSFDEMSKDQISLVDFNHIKSCYEKIKSILDIKFLIKKEQKFMLYLPYNQVLDDTDVEDKVLVQGVIDLMVINLNEVIIIDYKTNKLKKDDLIEKYKLQLELYAKNIINKKVKKYLYSFYLNELIEV